MGRNNGTRFRAMRARLIAAATVCPICLRPIDRDAPTYVTDSDGRRRVNPDAPVLDHVVPVSHGGTDDAANARITHARCNGKRGNRAEANVIRRSNTIV